MSRTELPQGWRLVSLRDACRLINGRAFKPTDWVSEGLPIVRIQNLNDRTKPYNRYSGAVDEKHLIDTGALLFAWSGTPGTSFGAHVWEGGRAVLNQHIFRVLPNETLVTKAFLRHAINERLEELIHVAHGGAGLAHVTKPVLESTELRLPRSLDEQRRIVAKLDALRARGRRAKEALDAVPALLDRLRQSILAAAFRGDLTADWRAENPDVEPASELLKRIRIERRKRWEEAQLAKLTAKGKPPNDDRWKAKYVEPEPVDDSDLPELPNGWCWAGLSEVAELQLGQRRAPEFRDCPEFPYVRAGNITWDGLDLSDVKMMGFDAPDNLFLKPGDVLLNEASGSPTEVGKPALWRGEIDRCCFQATVLRVRAASADADGSWLHASLLADALLGRFAAMAPGVGILHLTAERMRAWPVPIAPLQEQPLLVERVQEGLARVAALRRSLSLARSAYDQLDPSVLAAAFRGELVERDASPSAVSASP